MFKNNSNPSFIKIVPYPSNQPLVAANCLPGYPVEEVTILNHLGLNQAGAIGVEPVSWGAIKDLYR